MLRGRHNLMIRSLPFGPLRSCVPRKEQLRVATIRRIIKTVLMIIIVGLEALLFDLLDRVKLLVVEVLATSHLLAALV